MNTKHTPGPWLFDNDEYYPCIRDGKGNAIIHGDIDGGLACSDEDAHLIASAPDFLKAALVFKQYESDFDSGDDVSAMVNYAEFVELINSAIAKATGEQP